MAIVSRLPNSLLREPFSQDWPLVYLELLARCPKAEDRQETAALAALETPKWRRRASQLCYVSGRKRLREVLAGDRCALKHWQGWQADLLRALRRDGHRVMRCTPLFPRGACPHKSWAMGSGLHQKPPIRNDGPQTRVIFLGRLKNQSLLKQDPMRHAWQGLPQCQVTY